MTIGNDERKLWVINDEDLYYLFVEFTGTNDWTDSAMQEFIENNKEIIDDTIQNVLSERYLHE